MTAGGDRLDYPDDRSSSAVSILNTNIHINSTISDAKKGARYMTMDIKIYLGTPMDFFQYIRVPQRFIPSEIKNAYNLVLEVDGYSYFEIRKGMYGLREAGIIAYKHLVKNLLSYGYEPMQHTHQEFGNTDQEKQRSLSERRRRTPYCDHTSQR